MNTLPGKMVISLDFELLYGLSDLPNQDLWKDRVLGGRSAIPEILDLFTQYGIHATWATVGMLFAQNKEDWTDFIPDRIPSYKNHNYDPDLIGFDEANDPLHFGRSLISAIRSTPQQEIASHTFSHYYCTENYQTAEEFESDISAAVRISGRDGIQLKSIVFPRNQVRPDYLGFLKKYGILAYRGNERSPIYSGESVRNPLPKRALRLLDSYVNISGMNCYRPSDCVDKEGIINIPSSRFLRPYMPALHMFEGMKIRRIKRQMLHAAKTGKIFHIWWHPHNFGENLHENISNLSKILSYYKYLNERYGFTSASMGELAEELI